MLTSIAALVLVAIVCGVALGRTSPKPEPARIAEQVFQVHGRIRTVNPTDKTVSIADEEIPDFMPL